MTAPLTVHMLSGNDEYAAEASLDRLAAHLSAEHGMRCTMSRGTDRGEDLPGLEQLDAADVVVVFCKRQTLPAKQLAIIRGWCDAGRPVVGIRTASHAFQNWLEFDRDVLGGDYRNHGPEAMVEVVVEPNHEQHPILAGTLPENGSWSRLDKVYWNPDLADDAAVLLRVGDVTSGGNPTDAGQPLAWCRPYHPDGGRVFYTSMGHPADFKNPDYLRLITNAIRWAVEPAQAKPTHGKKHR